MAGQALLLLLLVFPALAQRPPETGGPLVGYLLPAGGQRGTTVETTATGDHLDQVREVHVAPSKVAMSISKVVDAKTVVLSATIAPDAEPGQYDVRLVGPDGLSNRARFFVGQLPEVAEQEPNNLPEQAQRLDQLPVLVNGQITDSDRDRFRFTAKAGQTLVIRAEARALKPFVADAVPGWFDACLTLTDAQGRPVAWCDDHRLDPDPVLIVPIAADGEYRLDVHDILYRGRGDFVYRLSVGALPWVTDRYPLGARRGSTTEVTFEGVNLAGTTLGVPLSAGASGVRRIGLKAGDLETNRLPFAVGEAPEVDEQEPNDELAKAQQLTVPVTVNGRVDKPGDTDWFGFHAEAGQQLVLAVQARRLGSPLDSLLTLYNAQGGKLAENDDFVNPDEPLLTHHADSRLLFTFKDAGDYLVSLRDVQGGGGKAYAYRLQLTAPRPDFVLRVTPDNPRAAQGDSVVLTVEAERRDGFAGEIALAVRLLPPGYLAADAVLAPTDTSASLTITAPKDATPAVLSPLVIGSAKIGDQPVTRAASAAEMVMQAFSYKHYPPTRELALAVVPGKGFYLSCQRPQTPLELAPEGTLEVMVWAVRAPDVKGPVTLTQAVAIPGVQVRGAQVPAGDDRVKVVVTAAKNARDGLAANLILQGTMRVGNETVTRTLPAIPLKIVAPPPPAEVKEAPKP